MPSLFDLPGKVILNRGTCKWCGNPNVYREGQGCMHGEPPRGCLTHGLYTDLNLVTRGRRAVVRCTHYGNAAVVLYADPIADAADKGTYTVQFYMRGVGMERYQVTPGRHNCPHAIYDTLVKEMRDGARPNANRRPDIAGDRTTPGESL